MAEDDRMSVTDLKDQDSVTEWIDAAVRGDHNLALQRIWERYFRRLVGLAKSRMKGLPGVSDEEDVASQAFSHLILGLIGGRFPTLRDRDDLWNILVTITAHEANDRRKYELALMRDTNRTISEWSLVGGENSGESGFDTVVGVGPTAEFMAIVAEKYKRLLNLLADDQLRQIAVASMECYTQDEIAEKVGCSTRDVGRKLVDIRRVWNLEQATQSAG
jgi:DNA-directed RNA polymerase specialized sigma24 family protein